MATTTEDSALFARLQEIQAIVQEIQKVADPATTDRLRRVIQTIMEFHGAAIARLLDRIAADPTGLRILQSLADDELVSNLLLLYDLHPRDLPSRVADALEKVKPYLASHGGNVKLLEVTPDGRVRLQLQGSCHGCPSSQATLKSTIEQAIYAAAADVTAIEVEGAVAPAPVESPFVTLNVKAVVPQ